MELEAHILREGDAYKWDSGKRTIGTGAKLEIGITTGDKYVIRFDNGSSGDNIITTSLFFNELSEI